jgi:hypothetical protein
MESCGAVAADPRPTAGEGDAPVPRLGLPALPFPLRDRTRIPGFSAGHRGHRERSGARVGTSGTGARGHPRSGRHKRGGGTTPPLEVSSQVVKVLRGSTDRFVN